MDRSQILAFAEKNKPENKDVLEFAKELLAFIEGKDTQRRPTMTEEEEKAIEIIAKLAKDDDPAFKVDINALPPDFVIMPTFKPSKADLIQPPLPIENKIRNKIPRPSRRKQAGDPENRHKRWMQREKEQAAMLLKNARSKEDIARIAKTLQRTERGLMEALGKEMLIKGITSIYDLPNMARVD